MSPSRIWWLSAAAAAAVSLAVLSLALTQAPLPSAPPAAASNDPFGEEVTLVEKTIVYISGSRVWDSAFETIVGGFKTVYDAMAKQPGQRLADDHLYRNRRHRLPVPGGATSGAGADDAGK
jgi:hypothetical protein